MSTGDKLVNLDALKAVNDNMQGQVNDLKSAFDAVKAVTVIARTSSETTDIFSSITWTEGAYMDNDGSSHYSSGVRFSNKLTVKPGDSIRLDNTNYKFPYICCYNGNTVVPNSIKLVNSFTIPEGVNGLIVTEYSAVDTMPILYTEITVTYENAKDSDISELSDDITTLSDEIDNIISTVSIEETVPVSDLTVTDGYFINTSGTNSTGTTWKYYEYSIPENTISFTVKAYAGLAARLWLIENETGSVLGYSSDSSAVSVKTEEVDLSEYPTAKKLFINNCENYAFELKVTVTGKFVNSDKVEYNGETLTSVLADMAQETQTLATDIHKPDKLYGKTLVCVGDSITYGADMDSAGITNESDITVYNCNASGVFSQTTSNFLKTWGWQIANRHKMVFYNGGVSGSTMQGLSDKNGFSLANGRYTKLPDVLDYLLIWFGWNDNAYGTLGAITDTTNESYYGGFNVVLPYLINKYPYAKIGLIVPFGTTEGHREAVRRLGDKWGLAVWDNYQGGTPLYFGKEPSVGVDADIVTANRAKFQANGAHPNYKGHTQLADMIDEWIKGI